MYKNYWIKLHKIKELHAWHVCLCVEVLGMHCKISADTCGECKSSLAFPAVVLLKSLRQKPLIITLMGCYHLSCSMKL